MTRLTEVLAMAKAEGRAALVGYLPAGFPSVEGSIAVMSAMVRGGCDIIEVGLPYSDPTMDGPTIQKAADAALEAGTRTKDVLHVVEGVAATGAATLVMTYWNPIDRYGVDRFAKDFAQAGGSGLITPDLIPEEAGPWLRASDAAGLDRVFLVAPSSTDARLAITAEASRGFIYVASLMGVTGTREQVGAHAESLVARTRNVTDLPLCVGLGVSNGEQAAQVARYADGVIVGSAFCDRILQAPDLDGGVAAVEALAAELAEGVRAR